MKVNYVEGTWFAVPLRNGGFAVGLVARATSRGPCVLAYLFGPKHDTVPTLSQVLQLDASSAVKVARVGDLHLIDGRWPVLGHASDFRRSAWHFPKFVRADEIARRAWTVVYSEDEPGRAIAEIPVEFSTSLVDDDAAYGAGAVELVMTKILG